MRIAIIGAGLTGLTAANTLREAGLTPTLFDKGRGVGGRLATRRADNGIQFDHGAQYLSAKNDGFAAALAGWQAAGAAAAWAVDGQDKAVGLPGMTGIAKHLAQGLDIRQGVEVAQMTRVADGWRVEEETFDRVICTTPPLQAANLLGAHAFTAPLRAITMKPNLTLMLALPGTAPFATRRMPDADIAWLALDSAKPQRGAINCWVAQASTAFSTTHLERDKPDIAALMLPLVCDILGADPADALYVSAHRWRYARVATPFGQPFLADDGLYIGGDWTLGPDAEAAWNSGIAMAQAIIASA